MKRRKPLSQKISYAFIECPKESGNWFSTRIEVGDEWGNGEEI
jgi:hypothetical protein